MNTCPICHKPVPTGSVCENCGYDLSGDFTAFRTLSPVSEADRELLTTRRALAATKLQLAALSEKAAPESTTATERTECEYDSNGNVTKETVYNADGSVKCRREYNYCDGNLDVVLEYDSTGHNIKATLYKESRVWFTKEYDSAGNMTKRTAYNRDGNPDYAYEFDSSGHETKCTFYKDGSIQYVTEYDSAGLETVKTEYDKAGRRTKTTSYNADGSVRKIERTPRGWIADFWGR